MVNRCPKCNRFVSGIKCTPDCKGLANTGNTHIKKGQRLSPKTEIKKGEHKSLNTEIKNGEHKSKRTEFKRGNNIGKNNPRWTGGTTSELQKRVTNSIWRKKIRPYILKRDNYTCKKCRIKQNKYMTVHHIISFKKSKDDSYNNLQTLCRSCHMKEDWEIIRNGR